MPVVKRGFQKVQSVRRAQIGRNRKAMVKREPNGREQRDHGPDRGTDELQARRKAITGDTRKPIDVEDPIDVLHRGTVRHLTDVQAVAASEWRRARAVLHAGGPTLAQAREPAGEAREISEERFQRAMKVVGDVDRALYDRGIAVFEETRRVVIDREKPRRLGDLKSGLNAVAIVVGIA